jgi:hypothetical protein
MLVFDGIAFGISVGIRCHRLWGLAPHPVSTPGAFEGQRLNAWFRKGRLSGPAIFREMNGVLEGK